MMEPWSIFLYKMKVTLTREKYRGRLGSDNHLIVR
jgi:hypothetical protein